MIAIIPARSTSKRLPNKNFKEFFGKPMISWVLDEIRKSEIFDEIVVSTDVDFNIYRDINGVSINGIFASGIIPFKRKTPLYEDTVDDVCMEVLEQYPGHEYLMVIYPTAYAVTWKDICQLYRESKYKANFWTWGTLNAQYNIDNGGLYLAHTETYLNDRVLVPKDIFGKTQYGIEVPQVDINTLQDFCYAKIHAVTLPCGRFK